MNTQKHSGWHTAGRIAWLGLRFLAFYTVTVFAIMLFLFAPHSKKWTDWRS